MTLIGNVTVKQFRPGPLSIYPAEPYTRVLTPKYSIVVPLHNEQENVPDLYDRLKAVMEVDGEAFRDRAGR